MPNAFHIFQSHELKERFVIKLEWQDEIYILFYKIIYK